MIVDDVMTRDVATVPPNLLLKDVARLMTERGISGLPVVEDGKVIGVISEADILQKQRGPGEGRFHRNGKFHARTVADAMTSPAITVLGRSTLPAAATVMSDRGVNRLPWSTDAGSPASSRVRTWFARSPGRTTRSARTWCTR